MAIPRVLKRVKDIERRNDTVEGCVAMGDISGEITLELSQGRTFSATATGSLSVNISESAPGQTILFILSGGGSTTVNWGMNPLWAGGQAPMLSGRDLIAFTCAPDGIWDGVLVSGDTQ